MSSSVSSPGPDDRATNAAPPPSGARASGGAAPTGRRPTPVTVLSVLLWVSAAIAILGGLALMAGSAFVGAAGGVDLSGLALVGGLFLLVLGIAEAVVGYGLWSRMRWAWYAALAIVGIQILWNLVELVSGDVFGALFGLFVAGVIVWFLLRPDVQSWFGVEHQTPWRYGRPA